jgi:hypothetical protein
MSKLKYIIDVIGGFAIFPSYIDHDTVGNLMTKRGIDPVGAGFVDVFDGEVQCYGESVSMRMKSRGDEDSKVIAKLLDLKPI